MISKCDKCSRCKVGKCAEPYIAGSEMMIITECPGESDGLKAFSDAGGVGLLHTAQLITKKIVATSLVRCSGSKPSDKQIEACKSKWVRLVQEHRPKVIMTFGAAAAAAVLGRKLKLVSQVGQCVTIDFGYDVKVPVIFNYSPEYIASITGKKGGMYEKAAKGCINAWNMADQVFHSGTTKPPEVSLITKDEDIIQFLEYLAHEHEGRIFYDYETWGDKNAIRPELCKDFRILTIGVSLGDNIAAAFPYEYPGVISELTRQKIYRVWQEVVLTPCGAHNAKYEHKCNIKRFGRTSFLHDSMLAMNVVDELASGELGAVGLHCGLQWAGYKLESKGIQAAPIDTPIEDLLKYNARDAAVAYYCWHHLKEQIDKDQTDVALQIKEQSAMALAEAEMNGMSVDPATIEEVRVELNAERSKAEKQFLSQPAVKRTEQWAAINIKSWKKNPYFNASSPTQMQHLCMKELKLPVVPKKIWKNGQKVDDTIHLDKKVLERFEESHPIIAHLLKVRSIDAMFTSFLSKWSDFVGPDGCVHTNYNQAEVVTGRLSSSDPPLQNIPKGNIVRKVFRSRFKDGVIINADYSQLEPRIMAGWSQDENMITAFTNSLDLHSFVASKIFKVEYDAVVKKQRDLGKRMNLGIIYGLTPEGLAEKANIPVDYAKQLFNLYDEMFPGVAEWRKEQHRFAIRHGYVCDLFGQRRHLPDAQSTNRGKMNRALRQAGNCPIQSTGNSFCLIGLIATGQIIKAEKMRTLIIGTTHDSVVYDSPPEELEPVLPIIKTGMLVHNEADYWCDKPVPMKVDIECGQNLLELEKWTE